MRNFGPQIADPIPYVCCSDCRQAFEDDPEGILAEYKQMLAERKKKKS